MNKINIIRTVMQLIIDNALHTLTATFPQQTGAANGRVLSRGAGLMCLLAILSLFKL